MNKKVIVRGPGVISMLGVAFVVLKLCGVIDWSWVWVTLPFWAGAAFVIAVLLIIAAGFLLAGIVSLVVLVAAMCAGSRK